METSLAGVGDQEGAGVLGATDPSGGGQGIEEGATEGAGDVVALFGPVHAAAHRGVSWYSDAEFGEGVTAGVGELVADRVEPAPITDRSASPPPAAGAPKSA